MATIELNDDTLYTSALPAGSRLFGATSAAASEPTSFGREAIYNYVSAALAPVATSGSATDLTTGTLPLGRLHAFLADIASIASPATNDVLYFDGVDFVSGPATSLLSGALQAAVDAAEASADAAATSETNAASSASAASTSASNASTSASNASTSASNASTSASNASTSASSASTSASNASTSASTASTHATNAAAAAGFTWTFDTSTSMAEPSTGGIRFNNATIGSVTAIAVHAQSADSGNPNVLTRLVARDDSTSTDSKGTLLLRIGTSTWAEFTVTALTNNTTWVQFTVTYVGSAGSFSNGNTVIDSFTRTGDKGADGAGTGDVVGPASATDNAAARYNLTTGKLLQDSALLIGDNADLTAYDATNDGNPVFAYGASATERLRVVPTYDSGAQTLDYVLFTTDVASASADKGLFRFSPDGAAVLDIDDGGINFAASMGISIAGTDILTDSAGTATLSNIDALDATTEATIEAAIDTLANLGSIQGVAFTFGAYAATLLNTANEAAFKAAVNLEAGVDYQAYSAALAAYPDPTANDADALGTGAASWSDLFLASGGVINWNNGDVTATHSANALAFAGASSGYTFDALTTITAANANALAVGANGSTNPVLKVDSATASVATGLSITGAAAASRVAVAAISSGTDEGLSIDAKGSGTIRLGATSTGAVEFSRNAVPTASDGSALGTTALMWSDLFLASGGVINFNNGDVTITHSANALAIAGGVTALDASSTVGGSLIKTVGRETIYMPAGAMTARTTNGAASGTTELTTNDVMLSTFDFDQTTEEGVGFFIAMPKSWNESTVTFVPFWTAAAGSGGVVWGLAAYAFSNDDALDTAVSGQQTSTDTLIATGDLHVGPESAAITIGGTPAEGDLIYFEITREVANGSDTLTGDAKLICIHIYFTTNAATDA